MGVSATGSNVTFVMVRRSAVVVIAVFAALTYLYGPAVSPAMRQTAIGKCNDHAEGNWRNYRLHWSVGLQPHWECADASKPSETAVSLGWWTNPFAS
jgi:hypothetical protein